MDRKRNWIAGLALNLLIIALEIVALVMSLRDQQWASFQYYTQDSNLVVMAACGVMGMSQIQCLRGKRERAPRWAAAVQYVSVCLVSVTFLVVLFILAPIFGVENAFGEMLFSGTMLYHHLICPILAFVSFLFFGADRSVEKKDTVLALLPTLLYALVAVLLNLFRLLDGPYPFLQVYDQPFFLSVLWLIVILGGAYLIALVIRRMKNRRLRPTA